jgi:hypothetical protein
MMFRSHHVVVYVVNTKHNFHNPKIHSLEVLQVPQLWNLQAVYAELAAESEINKCN